MYEDLAAGEGMKELSEIIRRNREQPESGALATVVQTEGSSYRRPGARMLILPGGESAGSISGGCLEQDIIAHAQTIMAGGTARVLSYDTSTEEDLVFGVGLGCKGVVRVLVEPIRSFARDRAGGSTLLQFIADLFSNRQSGVVATVFAAEGEPGIGIGSRLMVTEAGVILDEFKDTGLSKSILDDARAVLMNRRSKTRMYEAGTGGVEVLLEIIESPTPLVIFGAGFDAIPLVRMAVETGFRVSVADGRAAYATKQRFPDADQVLIVQPGSLPAELELTPRTAAVIMSHNYALDRAFLTALLPLPLRYLGMMGPKKRAEKMVQESREEGFEIDDQQLHRLHNPIGLDIGAEGPEQIALAVLGEIQAVIAGHGGGFLREKKTSIHAAGSETVRPGGSVVSA
jgi:xanthine/CO dehydrogenase XdhC/CoxF family maturation factor